ncbi:MAG: T9SS type A sorting domain-containing protein [Candidatus Edwardsbacteria bacterium]|nr:T9SS type A sorting domain-containing protein [Candidatus Edwardsbacteria bacterium]
MMRSTISAVLAVLGAFLLPAVPALAQWAADGAAVCTAAGSQEHPTIVSDGTGGAIITWYDFRNGNNDIYAQRVNSAGEPQWAAGGVALCTAAESQYYPTIVSDGTGGAIITWYDFRNVTNCDIYAQRVNSAGEPQWTADGVALCTAADNQYYPTIVSDGTGGAIINWCDYRSGTNYDIYAQRVNSAGEPQWTANGVALCTAAGSQYFSTIVSDGWGGAVITWGDFRNGTNYDIYAQRVNSAGAAQWTANGAALCTAAGDQYDPTIVSDGWGGAVVTWCDYRSGTNYDIYAQRVSSAGAAQWTANGVALCTAAESQDSPTIVSDGWGGAIITWSDFRNGTNYDIYAQRVNSAGAAQWTADGAALCTAAGNQYYPTIVSDGWGGAIIPWNDYRSGTNYDIYAQRVDRYDGSYFGRNAPAIIGAQDIPNDQGGYVNLQWTPSYLDIYPDTTVSFYSLWRSLTGDAAKSLISKGAIQVEASDITLDFIGPAYRLTELDSKTYAWEWIANIPWQHYLTAYSYTMPTLCDTLTGEMAWHYFFVSAQTDDPLLYWDSHPDSGYSADNLAPAKVINLSGSIAKTQFTVLLNWTANTVGDLMNYKIYRSTSSSFVPNDSDQIGTSVDTVYVDSVSDGVYYYKVAAVDIHNNIGPASEVWGTGSLGVTGKPDGALPTVYALQNAYPNPSRGQTTFKYQLPRESKVSLTVYNVVGQTVKRFDIGAQPAGYHQISWNDNLLPNGVYFYRLQAGSYSATRKLVLLK